MNDDVLYEVLGEEHRQAVLFNDNICTSREAGEWELETWNEFPRVFSSQKP